MLSDEARPHRSPPCGRRRCARRPRGRLRRLELVRGREPRPRHGRRLDPADDDCLEPAGLPGCDPLLRQVPAQPGLQRARPELPAGRRRGRGRLLREQRDQPQRPEVPQGADQVPADPGGGAAAVQHGRPAEVPGRGAQVRPVHAQERRQRARPELLAGRRRRSRRWRWRWALRRRQHRPERPEGAGRDEDVPERVHRRRADARRPAGASSAGRPAERPGRDEPRGRRRGAAPSAGASAAPS